MKAFSNVNPRDLHEAVTLLSQAHQQGHSASIVGGGSDLLGMVKEHLVQPDVLVNLRSIRGLDRIEAKGGKVKIGGLTTLDTLSRDQRIRKSYTVLAEAAENVGTPQIRNVGTLAGNVCQRPWCWYFRNGFPCLKNGGNTCFSASGENQFHAIFGGGPSYIVHPSDTAPALVALDAQFHVAGPSGERTIPASDFFQLPRVDATRENVLGKDDVLAAITLPAAHAQPTQHISQGARSRSLDARRSERSHRARNGQAGLPQRPHRPRRRRAHPVALAEGGSDAGRPAHHARTSGQSRRSRRRRCASAGQKQIQNPADQRRSPPHAALAL